MVRVCRDNQKRMKVDPFEVMLMRMGFNVTRGNGDSEGDGEEGEEGEGEGEGGRRGPPAWVQDPAACRQS